MCTICHPTGIQEMTSGDHTCLIYSTMEEYRAVASEYIRTGLVNNELVICVIDEYSDAQLLEDLTDLPQPVSRYMEEGQLILSSIRNTYRGTDSFNPDNTLAYWLSIVRNNQDRSGIRVIAEATFALDGRHETLERLIDYEIRVNIELIPLYSRHQYCCVYNRNLYPAVILKSIIRSHPHFINGTRFTRENGYYLEPHGYYHTHQEEVSLYDAFHLMDNSVVLNLEKELRTDQERFRFILGSIGDGVWDLDVISGSLYVSRDLLVRLGLPEHAIRVLKDFEAVIHPDDLPLFRQELDKHRQNISSQIKQELRLRSRNGDWFWHECMGKAIGKSENGQVTRIVGTFRDIQARRMLEAERQNIRVQLEQRVIERTAQLTQANRELEAFSHSVSHDLRAPLRSIDGFGKALYAEYADILEGSGRHYIERIRGATAKMNQLINDLLNLSRLNQNALQRRQVDLSAMVSELVVHLMEQYPERRIRFDVESGVTAECDEGLMRVVFDNLLGNALKFTQRRESANIAFGCSVREGAAVYYVKDDGAGFDMAYADKPFGVFQRLHRQEEFEGNGIGLATVQRVISRHGGTVWAEGEIEHGATIFFTLGESQDRT